jgi:hypothetical protein
MSFPVGDFTMDMSSSALESLDATERNCHPHVRHRRAILAAAPLSATWFGDGS